MPRIGAKGAQSSQGFGQFALSTAANYIEDVFSTYLYTGTSAAQTINNGIDLSTYGGLTWIKCRGADGYQDHLLFDTARGATSFLRTNLTNGSSSSATSLTSFNSNGFSIGSSPIVGSNGFSYASWTFRKQPKFFDVVTYTGNGVAGRTVAHNLGSVPGCIVVKGTGSIGYWRVYHRSLGATKNLALNLSDSVDTNTAIWNDTEPTSTNFTLGGNGNVNASGQNYVAYLFAHDAGGFGLTGTDNVISCGSYTGNGSNTGPTITLGWEPQWVLVKEATNSENWVIVDNIRRFTNSNPTSTTDAALFPNTYDAEDTNWKLLTPTATGFQANTTTTYTNQNGNTYIYIAIRRGPMKTPTSGTSVFGLNARSGTGANATVTGGQTDDAVLIKNRGAAVADLFSSRLTGTGYLVTSSTAAEVAAGTTILQASPWDVMDGVKVGTTSTITNASSNTFINYLFRRAPGFFDEVCYTGTGSNLDVTHNLGVIPELVIVKSRSTTGDWCVYNQNAPISSGTLRQTLFLNLTSAWNTQQYWRDAPTASVVKLETGAEVNTAGATYAMYLFASAAGISKVGSYTGTGTTLQIDCGFTGGARFVLIKRTDSTGDWYVWDSARGIVAGNDPYLLLNSTAAEVTNTDYVDTYAAGFEISSTAPAAINANGGTFIFLAIS